MRDIKQTHMLTRVLAYMVDAIWETEKGTFLRAIVRPNSKEKKLVSEVTSEAIHINLRSQARGGKANSELLKELAKSLRISTSDISLISGHRSREKLLLISGISANSLMDCLLKMT